LKISADVFCGKNYKCEQEKQKICEGKGRKADKGKTKVLS
jgi:hypothetical protein